MSKKIKIQLQKGVAWKVVNGERKGVDSIIAPEGDDCCKMDCCKNIISYKSKLTGTVIEIPLDDIALSLGIIEEVDPEEDSSSEGTPDPGGI